MRDHAPLADILNRMSARAVDLGRRVPSESDLVLAVLVSLPKIGGCISASNPTAAGDLVEELIRRINGLITRSPDHADFVTAMMADLNELGLAGQIWGGSVARVIQQPDASIKHRRTRQGIVYFRRKGSDGLMVLAESRPNAQARDFFVRRPEYDRAVNAFAKLAVDEGVKFPLLFDAFAADEESSEYVLRVLLRFWRSRTPSLVERVRARYQIVGSVTGFRAAAQEAWDALPQQ